MAKKETTTQPPAGKGHNGSGLEVSKERLFIREFANIKAAEGDMSEQKGVLSGIYKRLDNAGFTKDHINFAKSLEKRNVSEVIADFEMKIAICRVMGHAAGRQLDMLDKDRSPIEDQAYDDGLSAGKLGRSAVNPYGMETFAGQRWATGFADGNKFRNEALNEAINGDDLIKGAGDADNSGEDENGDGDQSEENSEGQKTALDGELIPPGADTSSENTDDDWDAAAPKTAA